MSNKMFTQTARDLERNGILRRKVYPVVPPRVEYELTELGMSVLPIIFQMCDWGTNLLEAESEMSSYTPNFLLTNSSAKSTVASMPSTEESMQR